MLSLACFAAAAYLVCRRPLRRWLPNDSTAAPAEPRTHWRRTAPVALALIAIGVALLPDRLVLQKHLTQLASPVGLTWLLTTGLCVLAWEQGRRYALVSLLLAWTAFTAAGNEWLSHWWLAGLQAPYAGIDPLREGPFDAVVVLGGSVGNTPTGQTQLTDAGDRVLLGARLFLTGRTGHLVTTGSRIAGLSSDTRDQSERTAEVWEQLGVPADRIHRIGGRNTKEESHSISRLVEEHAWTRIGLVTSAWHMPRAQRLMRGQGLELEPLPANFEAHVPGWSEFSLVPEGSAFGRMQRAWKEMLAGMVGR